MEREGVKEAMISTLTSWLLTCHLINSGVPPFSLLNSSSSSRAGRSGRRRSMNSRCGRSKCCFFYWLAPGLNYFLLFLSAADVVQQQQRPWDHQEKRDRCESRKKSSKGSPALLSTTGTACSRLTLSFVCWMARSEPIRSYSSCMERDWWEAPSQPFKK